MAAVARAIPHDPRPIHQRAEGSNRQPGALSLQPSSSIGCSRSLFLQRPEGESRRVIGGDEHAGAQSRMGVSERRRSGRCRQGRLAHGHRSTPGAGSIIRSRQESRPGVPRCLSCHWRGRAGQKRLRPGGKSVCRGLEEIS